ncbi:hypothetical protein DL96DRAFT_1470040 [Flagelloscypha sp. PMI_526]|nr:hypothetical protein DL96DRAFT_1470040 [Flagelloscypha sp. PMI_526]
MDSEHTKYSAHGLSQARQHRESKPKFSDFACSYVEVYRYLVLLTDEVIPKAFWGSGRNYKTILKCERFPYVFNLVDL